MLEELSASGGDCQGWKLTLVEGQQAPRSEMANDFAQLGALEVFDYAVDAETVVAKVQYALLAATGEHLE